MNKNLTLHHHVLLKGFVDRDQCIQLSKEFKEHTEEVMAGGDEQVPESMAVSNFIPFVQLLSEKTKEVSEIVGEKVIPSYSYSRIYRNGNKLDRHLDRKESEIAISVNLNCDEPWPLWLETPSGEKLSYVLEPGDALLYLGTETPHWRDPFDGQYCNNVFLFYVLAEGPYRENYFDRLTITQTALKELLPKGQVGNFGEEKLSKFSRIYPQLLSQEWCANLVKLESITQSLYADNHVSNRVSFLLQRYSIDTSLYPFGNDTGYCFLDLLPGGQLDLLSLQPGLQNRLEAILVIALTDELNSSISKSKIPLGGGLIQPWSCLYPSTITVNSSTKTPQRILLTWLY